MNERVPQYKRIPCPECGNYAFHFVNNNRKCVGLQSCGLEWDPGEEGRRVVRHRNEEREARKKEVIQNEHYIYYLPAPHGAYHDRYGDYFLDPPLPRPIDRNCPEHPAYPLVEQFHWTVPIAGGLFEWELLIRCRRGQNFIKLES